MKQIKFIVFVITVFLSISQAILAEQPVVYNTRISIGYDGSQANGNSYIPIISNNGRFIVFASEASNLIPNDTNGKADVFVFDLETEIMERISVASNGLEGNDNSGTGDLTAISNDGRYVVFASDATNLVANDTNNCTDYEDGVEINNINCRDIFIKDRLTNEVKLISINSVGIQGNGTSRLPSISTDGRYVSFMSKADNLVDNDTNGTYDIFVHDLLTNVTKRVSINTDGTEANDGSFINTISADGHYVVFETFATNLAPEDIDNTQLDVYMHGMETGETSYISIAFSENSRLRHYSLMPDVSANGNYISFLSGPAFSAGNGQIYRYNQLTNVTEMVSTDISGNEGNRHSNWSSISDNGQWITFTSNANNLINASGTVCADCGNVFLKDMDTGKIYLITKNISGGYSNSKKIYDGVTSISGNGNLIAFDASSDDLIFGDTNNYSDIFVYGWKNTPIYSVHLPLVFKQN